MVVVDVLDVLVEVELTVCAGVDLGALESRIKKRKKPHKNIYLILATLNIVNNQ